MDCTRHVKNCCNRKGESALSRLSFALSRKKDLPEGKEKSLRIRRSYVMIRLGMVKTGGSFHLPRINREEHEHVTD